MLPQNKYLERASEWEALEVRGTISWEKVFWVENEALALILPPQKTSLKIYDKLLERTEHFSPPSRYHSWPWKTHKKVSLN